MSDSKRTFDTGSVRDTNTGKPRVDLISPYFLERLGVHLGEGAEHYGDRNWEKGQPYSVLVESFMRHAVSILAGRTDYDHLSAAAFGLMAIAHFEAIGNPAEETPSPPTWRKEVVADAVAEDEAGDNVETFTITVAASDEASNSHVLCYDVTNGTGQAVLIRSIPLKALMVVFEPDNMGWTVPDALLILRLGDQFQMTYEEVLAALKALIELGWVTTEASCHQTTLKWDRLNAPHKWD